MCVCVCVCVCVCACVCICVCVCVSLEKSHAFDMVLRSENLLGVEIDKKLVFDKYIYDLSKETNRRISEIARVSLFMKLSKTKLLMNVFFHLIL